MSTSARRSLSIAAALALGVIAAAPLQAGVVVEQTFEVGGFGPTRIGAASGTTVSTIEGDRSRDETTVRLTGKVLGKLVGDRAAVTITRIDRGLIWTLAPEKNQYTEMTFEELRRQHEQMLRDLEEASKKEKEKPSSGDSEYVWEEPRVEVSRTGKKETLAGIPAEQVLVTVSTLGRHRQTGETCESVWALDLWNGAETPATRQVAAYGAKLAEAMGFGRRDLQALAPQMTAMLGDHAAGRERAFAELAKLGGTSLRVGFSLALGGGCAQQATGTPPSEESEGDDEEAEAPRGIGGLLGKKVLDRVKRGREKDAEAPPKESAKTAPAPTPAPGTVSVFSMKVETTSIREATPPPATFELPAGATKKK